MTTTANAAQSERWNGAESTPWIRDADRYDTLAAGFTEHLFTAAALTESDRVLDIGCGTGQTTRIAARRAVAGAVTGIDISAPLLEHARRRAAAERLENASFVLGDAQTHPLPEAAFDIAISRAGVMFFADPVAAFGNIGRALRAGGRIVFVCHRQLEANPVLEALLGTGLPLDLGAGEPGVMAFTDPDYVRKALAAAGFDRIDTEAVDATGTLPGDATAAADFLLDGNLHSLVGHLDSAARARAHAAITAALRPFEESGAVRLPAAGWRHSATSH